MLRTELFAPHGIRYIHCREPFSLDELYDFLVSGQNQSTTDNPVEDGVVLDLRDTNVENIPTAAFRRHLMKAGLIKRDLPKCAYAYLVSGTRAFAKVRLANVLADLAGVQPEYLTLVSEDPQEVAEWLAIHCSAAPESPDTLASLLSRRRFEIGKTGEPD